MLVRFVYLAVAQIFAVLRLLPMSDRDKTVEIRALRHQVTVLHRQLGDRRPWLRPEDRAFLVVLLVPLSRVALRRLRLLVSPDAVLRWHRDLVRRRHARVSRNRRLGRPRTVAELLDRTLIWNEVHLRHALREYERHYDLHRPHRALVAASSLRARPRPLEPDRIERLAIRRRDRLGGVLHEYRHAA